MEADRQDTVGDPPTPSSTDSSTLPKVTALVTSFNYGQWISRALSSISAQTYENVEVVIVDDASTDDSVRSIQSWMTTAHFPVHFVAKPVNEGHGAALRAGLACATGEFVAFLDADDVWYPDKLKEQVQALSPIGLEMLMSDVDILDDSGCTVPGRSITDWYLGGDQVSFLIRRGTYFAVNGTLVSRAALEAVDAFEERRRSSSDYEIWLKLALRCELGYLPAKVGAVMEHAASLRATRGQQGRKDQFSILTSISFPSVYNRDLRWRVRRLLVSSFLNKDSDRLHFMFLHMRRHRDVVAPMAVALGFLRHRLLRLIRTN